MLKKGFKKLSIFLENQSTLKQADIDYIASFFYLKTTERNEILVEYSAIANYFFFINKGVLRIFTMNSEGMESSPFFAYENMFCTVLPSFIDQKPANEYLQSIEKSKLLVLNRTDFYDFFRKDFISDSD